MTGSAGCVARMGGDEYALLVPAVGSLEVIGLAQHILAMLERPIMFHDQPLDVGASVGIACFPLHAADAETLLRNADIAMYVAKRSRSGYVVFDSKFDNSQQQHLSMLSELRSAVEHGELRLHYQPKVTLATSAVTAVEALLRWPIRLAAWFHQARSSLSRNIPDTSRCSRAGCSRRPSGSVQSGSKKDYACRYP